MADPVRVKGYRELMLTFAKLSKTTQKAVTKSLRVSNEPTRRDAEGLAVANIRNIGSRWSAMRIGVTTKMVYVAPKARGRGGRKRPNLALLLLDQSMIPAVERNEPSIVESVDRTLDFLSRSEGF